MSAESTEGRSAHSGDSSSSDPILATQPPVTDARTSEEQVFSYPQIIRSSSIIGGAQGINYLIALVRTKLVAVILGPAGVGLVGLCLSAMAFLGMIGSLGIGSSGVREVAEANGSGDAQRIARTVKALRRACWATGLFSWGIAIASAPLLSRWMFESPKRGGMLAVLGGTLLLSAIQGGQSAVLQGMRRIRELAYLNVLSALASTLLALALYPWLGQRGIVPVLIGSAAASLAFSWWLTRKVELPEVRLSWCETWEVSKRLASVGFAFSYGAVLAAAMPLITSSLIARQLGLAASGIYQAAWAISGMFAGFILSAMTTDFYPRLTAVANHHPKVNRLVNEQIEIGILLALPGLLATLAFAPWVMKIFYTTKFVSGAELLPWFVLGVFGRVVGWPIGVIQMAKGATGWLVISQTHGNVILLVLTVLLLKIWGLPGAAIAFALLYVPQSVLGFAIARRLTQFHWSRNVLELLVASGLFVGLAFAFQRFGAPWFAITAGAALTIVACCFCFRELARRLGHQHRLVRFALRIPGVAFVCRV